MLQRKLEQMGASFDIHNVETLTLYYKLPSQCIFYRIATKAIDLKDLKELTLHGDKLELPKPAKPVSTQT